VDTGEATETVDASANQLAGSRSPDRWVLTVGKFGVTDVFDTNQYAHDPRADFLNWAAVDAGTFDYAADAWGFTVGAALEWYHEDWTLRAGLFDLSSVPNSEHLEPGGHEYQTIGEIERRYTLGGRAGRSLVTVYQSYGRMALLDDAVRAAQQSGLAVDPAAVREYRTRTGISLSLEQAVNEDVGLFARLGSGSGNVEAYEFTDIDRALELGTSVKGSRWSRAQDTVGLVLLNNRISATRQRYLDAGGLGILVGDGKLPHPGPEQIVETYYNAAVLRGVTVTLDYQWVNNPGYNRDRGPASIVALRVHAQF
jgi:high affinity Mn2+ porin